MTHVMMWPFWVRGKFINSKRGSLGPHYLDNKFHVKRKKGNSEPHHTTSKLKVSALYSLPAATSRAPTTCVCGRKNEKLKKTTLWDEKREPIIHGSHGQGGLRPCGTELIRWRGVCWGKIKEIRATFVFEFFSFVFFIYSNDERSKLHLRCVAYLTKSQHTWGRAAYDVISAQEAGQLFSIYKVPQIFTLKTQKLLLSIFYEYFKQYMYINIGNTL